jgi:peptidoglycan DL-endopeptidase CwlO
MVRPARRTVRLLALAVAGASLASGIVAAGPASAQSVKAQIASAQRQLAALNNSAEAASERYDAARIKLQTAQTAAAGAQAQLRMAQLKVDSMQSSVAKFAVSAYEGDGQNSLLSVTEGSTSKLLGRIAGLQAVSASQSQTLVRVEAARRAEEQAQTNATAALAAQRSATTAMAADRNQVLAAASKEQSILSSLQAKEAAIIKAAKARAARAAAERAAATLAREQAAAKAAAAAIVAQPVSPPPPAPAPAAPASTSSPGSGSGGGSGGPVAGASGASIAVQWAHNEIGKPYVWGAAGPNSFDCSGLAMYVWAKAGVALEHFTGDQWNEGTHVSRDQLEPGDLVFFAYNTSDPSTIHHVGIYIGGGTMIDAPFTGVDVREDPAFRSDYIGAVRP